MKDKKKRHRPGGPVPRVRRVLLAVPLDFSSLREAVLAIHAYPGRDEDWDFFGIQRGVDALRRALRWDLDGVIGVFGRRDAAAAAARFRAPVVNLYGGSDFGLDAQVGTDHRAIGRMGALHLLDLGFRHFGFVGLPGEDFSDTREAGYAEALAGRGFRAAAYDPAVRYPPAAVAPRAAALRPNLCGYLAALPKPAAVFCSDDFRAHEVAQSCRHLGLEVPALVAVLGVNDDDLLCGGSVPPLSSVRIPARRMGTEAARALDRLMRGGRPVPRRVLLEPECVAARQSTDVLHVADGRVAAALRCIRAQAAALASVDEVARAAGLSRRALERRFVAALGRTVRREIVRRRIELAQARLRETDDTIDAVAEDCGFGSGIYLSQAFRRLCGLPPGAYRRQFRARR